MSAPVPDCLLPYGDRVAWVAWNLERRQGEARKVPRDPRTGAGASVSNPASWGTLAAARRLAAARAYPGVGIVSAAVPAVVFLDLDRCLDPATGAVINDDASRLLEFCAGSYAERTPSGTGLRIIGTAPAIGAVISRRGTTQGGLALEICKAAPRYLTVTAQRLAAHPDALADIGDAVLDLLPLLGSATGATEAGADGRADAELVRRIATGEGLHAELCALAARYIGRGIAAAATVETLRGLLLACPEAARDARWQDRFASIPDLVASAAAKYAASAGQRRTLASLACRLLRHRLPAAAVREAVLSEAEAHGIDAVRAEGILAWAAAQELARREVPHA